MDTEKHAKTTLLGLCILVFLSAFVTAECLQYVFINDMLEAEDLTGIVWINQNDNMSRRFIKTANFSEGEFQINCNVTYDFYLPVEPAHVRKNPGNSSWGNFILYAFLGVILLVFVLVLLAMGVRWGYKKL